MNNSHRCPKCGGRLRKRTSKPLCDLREARRECESCEYRDIALIQPEKIIRVSVVPTTPDQQPTPTIEV